MSCAANGIPGNLHFTKKIIEAETFVVGARIVGTVLEHPVIKNKKISTAIFMVVTIFHFILYLFFIDINSYFKLLIKYYNDHKNPSFFENIFKLAIAIGGKVG